MADMILIQNYLLQNNYDEAVKLFGKSKKIKIRFQEGQSESFKEALGDRLQSMKNKEITSNALDKFIEYLKGEKHTQNLRKY